MTRSAVAAGLLLLALPLASCTKEARKHRLQYRAESHFRAGQFDQAKVEYLSLLRLDPQNPVPYQRLGAIWFNEGAPLRAAPFLLKSRELAPDDLENRSRLARVFLSLGRRADSFSEAMNILQRSPNDAEAARMAMEAAQTSDEQARVDQALARMPDQNNASSQLAMAIAAAHRGDREAARQAVQKALAIDPKSALAHSFMATLLLSEKQSAKAGDELKLAAELSPPRSPEKIRYAQFQIQARAPEEAAKTLRSITTAAPDYLPAWLLLAELSLGKKDYNEAIKLLANVSNRDPENIDGTILQSRALMGKGETDKALQALERLGAKLPDYAPLKYEIARCYIQKNDPKQAIAVLNQALSSNPQFTDAALLLGQLNLRTGNTKAVIEAMEQLSAKHPELIAAKLLLADAYRAQGRLDDAATIFREQLKTSPDDAEASLALGIILRLQLKNDEAREMLERARQLAPSNPLPLMQLVDLDLATRDFAAAQRRVEEQMRTTPDSAVLYFLQGRIYAGQSNWDLAEAALTKALKLNPNFSGAYALLATVYAASNKLPDAARQLEAMIQRAPNDTATLMRLAVLYERLGDFGKARDTYEKLLAIAPEFAPALNNLAFIYCEHFNQLDRAYQLAQKARTLQPGDGSIADTLGWILYKKRDYAQAIAHLTEATAKSPNDPEIQYHLGMSRYMIGETEAAKSAFEQALKSPTDFAHKADAGRRLALLSKGGSDGGLNVQELESIVREQPDDLLARMQLGEKYEKAQLFKQAATQYEEVLKLNPKFVAALVSLAELHAGKLNDPAKALEYAKAARDLSPGDAHATLVLGRIAYQTGNYSWAYSLLKQTSDQLPDDAVALHDLGWAAFSVGKVTEATAEMQRVIQIAPGNSVADDARTWLAMMQAQATPPPPGTADRAAEVLKKDPNYAPAQLAEAAIAERSGDGNRATTLYQQVLGRFPDYGPAQKRLAILYAGRGSDLAKAYDLAMKARKSLPEDAELTRLLADISYQRKEYSRALELLEEAARKEPLDAEHLYFMGICSLQTNDTARAKEALTQALAKGLKEPLANEARRRLQSLK